MANKRFIDFPIATTVGDNDIILIWQGGANKQTTKATILSGVPDSLNDLTDVTISGLTNGQILRYDSVTGQWENTDQGNLDLNDLNDVTIVSPTNGQVLVYNSSTGKWENSSGGYVPYVGAVTTVNLGAQSIQAGSFVKQGGTSSQFLKANGSVDSTAYGTGSVTSVGLTMPAAFNVANSPITTAGTLAVTGAGTVSQYIRGDGSLADFPESSGGGSSVSYYLNGSVNQGTIGGVAYRELNKVPILGAGTDFTINADGYIASFITDAGDPSLLEIPGGNWNFETYFSASSGGGSPTFYVELYKVSSGGTATLIASNSGFPELIAFGTNIISYFSTLAVPTTTLALTDRLAIRYYVTHSGRTITLHTEDNHLCQIITTFTTGLTALNGLTAQVQNFAVGTSGSDFNIASATATHTFNLPTASATNRGALSSADWSLFTQAYNDKINSAAVTGTTIKTLTLTQQDGGTITASWSDLNTDAVLSVFGRTGNVVAANGDYTTAQVTESGNLYYTEARVNANANVAANTAARHNAVTLGTANGLSLSTQQLSLQLATSGQNGALSSTDWTTFNNKENAITAGSTAQYYRGDKTFQTLNTSVVPELTNLYYTEARVNANANVAANTAARHNAVTLGTANGLSLSTQVLSLGLASAGVTGALSGTDWSTFNSKQNALTLTTTGTSGAATLVGATLNIPNYGSALGAYLPLIGGTMTGNINWAQTDRGITWSFNTDGASIKFYNTGDGDTDSRLEFATLDNNNEYFRWVHIPSGGTTYESMRLVPNSSGNAQLIVSGSIIKQGGTSSQFLKADGSVDSTSYVPSGRTITINGTTQDLSANRTFNVGTVTSVTASSPLASSGGTTPNITIQQASGSQSGFLSSTDWTTFNNKQNALTNPVTGTGTTNYLPKFTGSTTIGDSQIVDDGTTIQIGNIPLGGKLNITNGNAHLNIYFATLTSSAWNSSLFVRGGSSTSTASLNLGYSGSDNDAYIRRNSDGRLSLGTSQNDKLSIFFGGNVFVGSSVGMSDNGARFQVSGAIYASDELYLDNGKYLRFRRSSGNLSIQTLGIPSGTDDVRLLTTGDFNVLNGSLTNLMTVKNGGNVGIGTPSPSEKLDVVGGGLAAGNGTIKTGITYSSLGLMGTFSNHDLGILTNGSIKATITSSGNVLIGSIGGGTGTASPVNVNLGSTFSTTAGSNLKLTLFNDTGGNIYGLGVSNNRMDFNVPSGAAYSFYTGNVLIGTTTDIPAARLNVNGSIRTANPDRYIAGNWRLGRALIGIQPANTHQIIVEIDGQTYVFAAALG